MTAKQSDSTCPLVTLRANRNGPRCPFQQDEILFELHPGDCVWLQGPSGVGKTTLAMSVADLVSVNVHCKLHMNVELSWRDGIPVAEHCGVLFQTTTLLDDLSVAGNLVVALHRESFPSPQARDVRIKNLLESVGLDYAKDAAKKPSELSGGMGRRASLALQLAQRKRVIVLDEPFAGLDYDVAVSVAKELLRLRQTHGTALLLISHEPELASIVLGKISPGKESNNGDGSITLSEFSQQGRIVRLEPADRSSDHASGHHYGKPNLFGTTFLERFGERLVDYILYSLPLIALAFTACGLAIAMLSADLLRRLDITDQVLSIVDQEVKPLIKMLTGEEPSTFTMMGVNFKVRSMINSTLPQAKATLYALGMTKLFVLEIGPLLTALLLCGRIGGSYAGNQATMQSTSQNKLLRVLGRNPQTWSWWPALLAALLAGPLLTTIGTGIALILGGMVGPQYGIGDIHSYWEEARATFFPTLRLRSFAALWEENTPSNVWTAISTLDVRSTNSNTYWNGGIEIVTYPPIFHWIKAQVFIVIIMLVAELCARWKPNLTPRGVPFVITSAVVLSGLLVIMVDWGFSQLLLLRK
jgi:ABC-type nitrate/sulfonate/bicarbonate transport system ATPase subunit/ABC-type transporter Mla maintaining outer membrane lipid asymmetry permease subunit MlaE